MQTAHKLPDLSSLIAYKAIKLRKQSPKEAKKIQEKYGLSLVTAKVLAARGYSTTDELASFLQPTLRTGLADPSDLKSLKEASLLIEEIVLAKCPIAVCCDFDVDGLSGGSQIVHFLKSIGSKVEVFVPDRFTEGYGLNAGMVNAANERGCKLLITVDFGTTNEAELALARDKGMKSIVIDHHHVSKNPPADVFVNPCQAGCGFAGSILCAAGLVWYLLLGIRKWTQIGKSFDPKMYLDLACLGTICDMVPLVGVNRIIAKRGLELLHHTERPGLRALRDVSGVHKAVHCHHVSFGLGPRLNAAGRMLHGEVVIELLTTSDISRARKIATKLDKLNQKRKDIEERTKKLAIEKCRERGKLPAALVVWNKDFHTGVIGLVAQRLVENFYRPSAVMGVDSDGIFKGSVRGIKDFSVVETLSALKSHLIKFGGHAGAGGFSIKEDKIEEFAAAFEEEVEARISDLDTVPLAQADCEVSISELTPLLVEELRSLAPFGMGNPSPQLLLNDVTVTEVRVLKDAHLKATFFDGKRTISAVMWRQVSHPALIPGQRVKVVFKPEINDFGGNMNVQANLQALEAII